MSFQAVEDFEIAIAQFYGAPYAVAVDCCTHGIELCLRMTGVQEVSCPAHTYISVPFTFEKLGLRWHFRQDEWEDYYNIGNTNIIDAAVYFKPDSYIENTFMSLSFQFKKPLGLGRGGAVLCTNQEEYVELKKLTYDGRYGNEAWANQNITTIGYHYYMTPETAQLGLDKLPVVAAKEWPQWTWQNYPDLTKMAVFNGK